MNKLRKKMIATLLMMLNRIQGMVLRWIIGNDMDVIMLLMMGVRELKEVEK